MLDFIYIDTIDKLKNHITDIVNVKLAGVDTETTGLNPKKDKLRLVQIAIEDGKTLVIDWFKMSGEGKRIVKEFLEGDIVKVLHNAKFDYKFLYYEGIDISKKLYDTMIAAQLIDSGAGEFTYSLEDVLSHFCNININKEQQKSDWSQLFLTQEQLYYAAYDAYILLHLRKEINKKLKRHKLAQVALIEFATIPAIAQMELNGIHVDKEKLVKLESEYEQEKNKLELQLKNCFHNHDINLMSPLQLKKALESINIIVSGTSKEALIPLKYKYKAVELLLEYKKVGKLAQFVKKIITESSEDDRLYSNYFQCGTKTGRLSCSNINLQQMPHDPKVRECFTGTGENMLVIADYSQVELRIAGEIADDTVILGAYEKGQDLHSLTASLINNKPISAVTKEERQASKALNFGLEYGMGSTKLKEYALNSYGVNMTEEEAENFRSRFFQNYLGLKKWHRSNTKLINDSKGGEYMEVRTLANRRRRWRGMPSFTEFINTPVQGTGADIIKIALGKLPDALEGTSAKILATVHDEILLESDPLEAEKVSMILKNAMEEAGKKLLKKVPIIAEAKIARNWSEK